MPDVPRGLQRRCGGGRASAPPRARAALPACSGPRRVRAARLDPPPARLPLLLLLPTTDNPKIFTRCGHSFHMQCIYAWLERKATCPLCEAAMDLQDDLLL